MAKEDVARFFATVYENKSLQGSLNGALASAAPDVLTEIANSKGFKFTKDELAAVMAPQGGELSDADMDAVAGGASLTLSPKLIASNSVKQNFWAAVSPTRFGGIGGIANAFGLGIPGPDFVSVMSDGAAEEPAEAQQESRSATEIYDSLV